MRKSKKKTPIINAMDAKMLKILTYLILIMPFYGFGQVLDDFSDGDFTDNPAWIGTEAFFVINDNLQLQLNAETAGEAYLFCDADVANGVSDGEFEWRFWLREAFSPSTKNYSDIYLCDKYFVRFGEAGSNDVVDLQRVEGETSVSVCRGTDTFIATSFSAFFKITRDAEGQWKIYVDKTGSDDYILEAQGVDNTYEPSGRFGIKVTYSASNAKKVYLDDVYAGPFIVDSEPPQLHSLIVLKYNKIQLDFSEPVDNVFALDADNYQLDNNIGTPMYVEYNGSNHASLILSFSKTIEEGVYYTFTINKIQDFFGNISENIHHTFNYYNVHENDIVINEIMVDPEPSVGLPSCEYIELYNTTNHTINLKDWVLVIGNTEKEITQDIDIQSDGYVILCKDDCIEFLSEYGECVGFSSFSIPNTGSLIYLEFHKTFIFELFFDKTWYRDNGKSEGGWSLEQIDPHSPCLAAENWRASCDHKGGTPGAKNSVDGIVYITPAIDYIDVLSENSIKVFFNQKMDSQSLGNADNYTIVEFNTHPYYVVPSQDAKSITLYFPQAFLVHSFYKISVFGLTNCSGAPILDGCSYAFGLPSDALVGDVVINEILFNPINPASDYVEIFNKSDKVLNISDLKLGMIKQIFPNPPDTTIKEICAENRQLLPNSYLLLTTTPEEIGYQYECSTENFITMKSFPSYPNSGAAALLYFGKHIIDFMSYSEDSHYPLLTETKGVSLERVSPYICSDDSENWHSAAAPLYGTPGYQNSVFVENEGEKAGVEINPPVFSPDGDGFDDVTTINLADFESGYTAKIMIFDHNGRLVRNLVNCQNIANQSSFVWNGLDENGGISPVGIYVVFVEVFDIQGDIKRFKKAVVVASK